MIEIKLTRDRNTVIDDADSYLLDGRGWLCSVNRASGNLYAYRRDLGKREDPRRFRYLHRLIMERMIERPLTSDEQVDHRDGNSLNNCRSNLRLASRKENQSNIRRIRSKTGFKGVVRSGCRFAAYCGISGGPRFLGSFFTAEEAAAAYDKAAIKRRGQFAATNAELRQ